MAELKKGYIDQGPPAICYPEGSNGLTYLVSIPAQDAAQMPYGLTSCDGSTFGCTKMGRKEKCGILNSKCRYAK